MALYSGVIPFNLPHMAHAEERVIEVERQVKELQLVSSGDRVVILSGTLEGQRAGTYSMTLHEIV